MRLSIYHPLDQTMRRKQSKQMHERTLLLAVEIVEYSNILNNDASWAKKWAWIFRNSFQWHAMAYAASSLCHVTDDQMADRAWSTLKEALSRYHRDFRGRGKNTFWKTIEEVLLRARRLREESKQRQFSPQNSIYTHQPWECSPQHVVWEQIISAPSVPSDSGSSAQAMLSPPPLNFPPAGGAPDSPTPDLSSGLSTDAEDVGDGKEVPASWKSNAPLWDNAGAYWSNSYQPSWTDMISEFPMDKTFGSEPLLSVT